MPQQDPDMSIPASIDGCLRSCTEARALVTALSDDQYARPVGTHSSIGAHMRHCLDHYLCFFRGLADGAVDYDSRDRSADLEGSRQVFFQVIDLVESELLKLCGNDLAKPVTIQQIPSKGATSISVESSIERELVFLSSHSIHHMALMVLLAEMQDVSLVKDLGVAYSTQDYHQRLRQAD